jgi:hypothetical protein
MLRAPSDAERVNLRVFEQPQFIRAVRAALRGELLHRAPRRFVFDSTELAHKHTRRGNTRGRTRIGGNFSHGVDYDTR